MCCVRVESEHEHKAGRQAARHSPEARQECLRGAHQGTRHLISGAPGRRAGCGHDRPPGAGGGRRG